MKTKSKAKIRLNKIPFAPKKIKPIKKIIKLNPSIHQIKHFKHPSTPLIIFSKKFETKVNNKKEIKNDINKTNPFPAIIPKSKPNSEHKKRKQKIVLIKKTNYSNKKQINNKRDILQSNKNLNLNSSKSDTKCDTTLEKNSFLKEKNIKQRNTLILNNIKNSEIRNALEFTFSNDDFIKNNGNINNIGLFSDKSACNKVKKNFSFQKKINCSRILHLKKNVNIKINIKNLDFINPKNDLNMNKHQNNKTNIYNVRKFSKEEKDKIRNKSKEKDNTNIKNISKINKTSKIAKKFINLIPYDKNHKINKKTNINNNDINFSKNIFDISHTVKNKDNHKRVLRLLINNSPKKILKKNKSNPKLFIKHPSLRNLFGT